MARRFNIADAVFIVSRRSDNIGRGGGGTQSFLLGISSLLAIVNFIETFASLVLVQPESFNGLIEMIGAWTEAMHQLHVIENIVIGVGIIIIIFVSSEDATSV